MSYCVKIRRIELRLPKPSVTLVKKRTLASSLNITVTSYWARWCLKSPASRFYWSTVCSADQRKHQSSVSLAFVRGIHRWPVDSPHKGPVTLKMLLFDDVIIRMDGCHMTVEVITWAVSWLNAQGVGVTKPVSSVPSFSPFSTSQKHTLVLNITFNFDGCRRSSAVVTPVKYECDSINLTVTFVRSKILLAEKWTNGALVTPTHGQYICAGVITTRR